MAESGEFDIRTARSADVPGIARVMSRSFFDDPLFAWQYPRRNTRLMLSARASAAQAGFLYVPLGHTRVAVSATSSGTRPGILATAIWQPADAPGPGPLAWLRCLPHELPLLGPRRAWANMRFLRLLREIVPREPHGELVLLGVDPAAQRRGIGSALVRDGLDQADLAGYPVALVTTNSDDIAFYRRFDFKVCGELDRSGFPRAHCMWRDPAF